MGSGNGPVVVKFGGSFARSVHLRHWVKAFAACAGRIVLVPGGGPFADAVRSAQSEMGFDNRAAHHMALLAMEQFGRALASLDGTLAAAESTDGIHRELAAEHVPVWMPTRMVLNAADLAASWDVTSDTWRLGLLPRLARAGCFSSSTWSFRRPEYNVTSWPRNTSSIKGLHGNSDPATPPHFSLAPLIRTRCLTQFKASATPESRLNSAGSGPMG